MPHHVGPRGRSGGGCTRVSQEAGGRRQKEGGPGNESLYCGFCRKQWAKWVNKAYDYLAGIISAGSGGTGAVSSCLVSGWG